MSDRESEPGEVQEQQDDKQQTKQKEEKQETKQKEEKTSSKTDEGKTKQKADEGKSKQKSEEGKSKSKNEDEKPKESSQTNNKQEENDDGADDEAFLGESESQQQIANDDKKVQGESENNSQPLDTKENISYTGHDEKLVKVSDERNDDNTKHDQKDDRINSSEDRLYDYELDGKDRHSATETKDTSKSSEKEIEFFSETRRKTEVKSDNIKQNDTAQGNSNIENESPSKTSEQKEHKTEENRSRFETSSEEGNNEPNEDKFNSKDTFITQKSNSNQSNGVVSPSHTNSEEQFHFQKEHDNSSTKSYPDEKSTTVKDNQNESVEQDKNKSYSQTSIKGDDEYYESPQEKDNNLTEEGERNQKAPTPSRDKIQKENTSDINDSDHGSDELENGHNTNMKDDKNAENKNYFYISTPRRAESQEESLDEPGNGKYTSSDDEYEKRTQTYPEKSSDETEKGQKDTTKQSVAESEYLEDEFDSASEKSEKSLKEADKSPATEKTTQEPTENQSYRTKDDVVTRNEDQVSSTEKHVDTQSNEKHRNVDFENRTQSNDTQNSPKKKTSERSNTQSPRRIMAEEKKQKRQTAQSADYRRLSNRGSPRRGYHVQNRPKTTGQRSVRSVSYSIGKKKGTKKEKSSSKKDGRKNADDGSTGSEAGGRKQREFFKEELKRLQNSLQVEKSKIHKPKERDYYPYTFTSLEPYYNTYVASYLIELPEKEPKVQKERKKKSDEQPHGFVTRNTAQGLCDPWKALQMDQEILPKLEISSKPSTTASSSRSQKKQSKDKNRPPKEGSTRLPKFPVVNFDAGKENATKRFPYSEIPQFREEMRSKFSPNAQNKVNSDYNRTKQDFYRMELDKIDEIHPLNRPHMRKAYFAYLQNTPGSRKAIKECAKTLPPCKPVSN